MATNMYGEKIPEKSKKEEPIDESLDETAVELIPKYRLDIDMNEPNLTLMSLIQRTKVAVEQLADDEILGIYLVSSSPENPYNFWNDYFDYLKVIENPKIFYFRGYLQFWNLGFFYSGFEEITILRSKLVYDCRKLHEILNGFSNDLKHFQNFSQRFLGLWKEMYYIISNDFTELEKIGLTFKLA